MIQNFRMLGKRNRERLGKRWQTSVIVWFVALFSFLFLFSGESLASAQNSADSQDYVAQSVPTTLEILRLGLTPSLKDSNGVDLSPELKNSSEDGSTLSLTADSDQKTSTDGSRVAMFRLYNQWTGEHFYTSSISERDKITKAGWKQEGTGWYAPTSEDFKPVYRLYNNYVKGGDHHYTTSADEKDECVKAGWTYEGEAWRTVEEGDADYVKVLRQYNPNAKTGTHNYTTSTDEQKDLVKAGWKAEGLGWGGYSKLEPTSSEEITSAGNYWLNVANSDTPESSVLKTETQVAEDMEVLHGTKTQTSEGKDKKAVTAEYTNYMNGKDADGKAKDVRLYTKWSGDTKDSAGIERKANKWVEFRIVQVGEHDSDGSAVTFMATHSLPAAKAMNSTGTNSGGWGGSAMRTSVFAKNGYVQAGLSGLANVAKAINKVSTAGNYDNGWTEGATTSDKFWILSHTEVFGNDTDNGNAWVPSYFYKEGTQYAWFKSKGVNAKSEGYSANTAIADIDKTRAGDTTTGGGSSYWWLRSPDLLVPISFAIVNTTSSYGFPTADSAERAHGVVPCFAF